MDKIYKKKKTKLIVAPGRNLEKDVCTARSVSEERVTIRGTRKTST
jgi:hypothetical protein